MFVVPLLSYGGVCQSYSANAAMVTGVKWMPEMELVILLSMFEGSKSVKSINKNNQAII